MSNKPVYILAIESSCDDTAAAILQNDKVLSNIVANQLIHNQYGGVVPELASRAHQQNIVPVIDAALRKANIQKEQLTAIAFTQGPGLMGSLLVGGSFAKSLSLALNIPLIAVNHMQAHILAHFIDEEGYPKPTFPFLALTIYLVNNIINSRSERIQAQLSNLSSFVQETFSGIRLIKAYVRENEVAGRFTESSLNYQRNSMDLVKVQALFYPIMLLLVGLSTIITVYVGGFEVINGHITAGNIAEFVVYVTQLTFPVMSLGWVTSLIQRAAASQKRINEFLHTEPEIKSGQTEVLLKGNIQFKNVSFTYPDTGIQALKNVNFELKKGELLAIIGKTGSGKSTLANLLMRMYDVQAGEICVEEQPIKNLNLMHYRSQIGFVPQEVFLFSDTIANNIAFGCSATLPEIETAAKQAAVHENINTFEKGYQTLLGERGITLSGGQKQRVSIARALVKQPSLLILDDSLSAVDTRTEEQILRNLDSYTQHSTTLIIAHRISSIKQANQILVLDGGEIIESGNHTQLLSKKGYYYELYQKQLLEEEIAEH